MPDTKQPDSLDEPKTTSKEDGVDKDAYTVAFTNGALEELEQLQQQFHLPNLESVVKLSIALLHRIDESKDESGNPKP